MRRSTLADALLLCRAALYGVLGINEARFGRDKKKRSRTRKMFVLYGVFGAMGVGYTTELSFLLMQFGLADAVLPLLALLITAVCLMFSVAHAGTQLFDLRRYEQEAALPLRPAAIVTARILTLLLENTVLSFLLVLPGGIVYGVCSGAPIMYYPLLLLAVLLLPLLPTAAAMLLGTLISGIASRMRHRNAVTTALSMAVVLAAVLLPSLTSNMEDAELVQIIGSFGTSIGQSWPPAAWFGTGLGSLDIGRYLLFVLLSVGSFALVSLLVGRFYTAICTALSAHAARGRFKVSREQRRPLLSALYRRELSLYFSYSLYVTNTLVGNVLSIVIGGALLFGGAASFAEAFPLPPETLRMLIPFLLSLPCMLSPTTASAISVEGRRWWQLRCLPLRDAEVLGAKLLVGLTVSLPCYAVAVVLSCLALRPSGTELAALLLIPLAYCLLALALGLALNLRLPNLHWEQVAEAVKQGMALLLTMLTGFVSVVAGGFACALLPGVTTVLLTALAVLLLAAGLIFASLSAPLSRVEERV